MNTGEQAVKLLKEYVTENEPDYLTHSQSFWNRARRIITLHETGEAISEAKSFNYKTGEWVFFR